MTPSISVSGSAAGPRVPSIIVGLSVCLVVGVALVTIEESVSWLPAPVIALGAGVALGRAFAPRVRDGATVAATYLLRAGIILLGLRLSIQQVGEIGGEALVVIIPCILFGGLAAFAIARCFGVEGRVSLLLAVGTAICGNSAIAAVAPSIDAGDDEIAASVTTITIYGTLALVLLPLIADLAGLSARAFGLWSGTAINDTSQVVASSFSVSEAAGEMATIVKLTRNLFIVPVVFGIAWMAKPIDRNYAGARRAQSIPWFVVMFVAAAVLASSVSLPENVVDASSTLSKVLILTALAGIGIRAASLRFDRRFLMPLAAGSVAGIGLAGVSLALVLLTS